MRAEESALLGLRGRLRLSAALLRAVWTRRGREELAQGGVERLLRSVGLATAGLAHHGKVAEPEVTEAMIREGLAAFLEESDGDGGFHNHNDGLKAVFMAMARARVRK